ncbi:alpha/beta hydrolase [Prosthecobacter sp.]|uniref:alpha/beta hydrolase n=1 Tax=Prosthecobacter sp. TaxID=1965333 RepID=UPI002ABB400A|nr:alpha/beta hydrolase [Prosthecobacter sp.]MDZ4403251.1 alpha/beta hydrolase [Prosthecobacter sp.]
MRLLITYLFLTVSCLLAQTEVVPEITFKDISYGTHERHKLDLWQAKSDAVTPLVIFIHGGGWAGGDKKDVPLTLLKSMHAKGVSVASINYRYSLISPLPAPVHDAARAVQFLRSKASEWKLDPRRFGAYGISAGGCTTLWLACHDDLANPRSKDPVERESSRFHAAVGMSPQTCLEPKIITEWVGDQVLQHPMIARAVGAKKLDEVKKPRAEWIKLLREFSPITHVSADDPPVLISNPRVDPLPATSPGSAIHHALFGLKFQEKVTAVGGTCILRIEDKATTSTPKPEEFLLTHLLKPSSGVNQ